MISEGVVVTHRGILGSGHNLWVGGLPRFQKSRTLEFRAPWTPRTKISPPLELRALDTFM